MCHTDSTFGFDEADAEAAQSGDVLGTVSCANAAAVFIVVPVNDVMATIFYTPMLTVRRKDFFSISLFWLATGHSVNDFVSAFPRFLFDAFSFNHEGLANMGEIQVLVECCGCPYFSGFDAAMIGRGIVDKIGFLPVLEEQGNIFA